MSHDEHVTLVITHKVQPEKNHHYERWLSKIMPIAENYPGHLGVNIIKPNNRDNTYSILLRFDNIDHLYAWQKSPDRQHYLAELMTLIAAPEILDVRPGAEFWFTPDSKDTFIVPKWKQYILSLMVIYPTVNFVNFFLNVYQRDLFPL